MIAFKCGDGLHWSQRQAEREGFVFDIEKYLGFVNKEARTDLVIGCDGKLFPVVLSSLAPSAVLVLAPQRGAASRIGS